MADDHSLTQQTAVDDVRRVREKIAEQHRGNMREHMEETNRIFEQLRVKLNLKLVSGSARAAEASTTRATRP
jgi:hypothetical protein